MKQTKRDLYFVAVKIFLEKDGDLFIFKDRYDEWDIPGGRIQKHEFDVPLKNVIARKIEEELGPAVKYKLGEPLVFMRHERREVGAKKKIRIFAIGYSAKYLGGNIKISSQHTEYRWVPIRSFNPAVLFRGGWLNGIREFLKLKRGK